MMLRTYKGFREISGGRISIIKGHIFSKKKNSGIKLKTIIFLKCKFTFKMKKDMF